MRARLNLLLATTLLAGSGTVAASPRDDSLAARLDATRKATLELRSMLKDYYGGPEVLLLTWLRQPGEPGYDAGLDFLAEKLAHALVWRDPLVVGTVGSSVTAAHDNCHDDSYQRQLERVMAPVWAAAEVPFEVRNAGQGGGCGDDHRNQIWCLKALVGDDVDIVHYSWTYFEAGNRPEPFHEMFYRWSLRLDHAPVPQILYTHDCSRASDLDRELLDLYAPFGADFLCMERGIRSRGYPGKEWGVVGDTLHTTTREGEKPGVSKERRDSLGVVFRNWHPGPLLFQTTADALAYRYSAALLRALDQIEASAEPRSQWPRQLTFDRSRLPKPRMCDPNLCGTEHLPKCVAYGDPVLGEADVLQLESGSEEPAWELWRRPTPPGMIPKAERRLPECAHPTACGGFIVPAGKQAGWLTFRLPDLEVGLVAVCCASKECGQQLLDAGVTFRLDGKLPAFSPEVMWKKSKCLSVQPRFVDHYDGSGTVTLDIRLPKTDTPPPAITHVFGL